MDEGGGVRKEGERLSLKEEGSGGELGSDLDPDPDPWKIWIRIRQNEADPLDPDLDPQHCLSVTDGPFRMNELFILASAGFWDNFPEHVIVQ